MGYIFAKSRVSDRDMTLLRSKKGKKRHTRFGLAFARLTPKMRDEFSVGG